MFKDVPEHREIDVLHLGNPRAICCHQLGDVLVDPGPESSHRSVLEALDGEVPARILLTHIHLDHAGATGRLLEHWPDCEVWVHERGARHLVDPSRLVTSATRIYGDDMQRLWGEVVPVPEGRLRILTGGETFGDWRVAYTPGHASHHVSYLHEPTAIAFVGDVGGVRIGGGPTIPPTPPPDIDLELWHQSVDLVAGWGAERWAITHFGTFEDVAAQAEAIHEGLERWGALARDTDAETYEREIVAEMRRGGDAATAEAFLQAMPPFTLYPGLERYWAKKNG
jgi:glyoxylase-like metal-dependent hydrolase (beta-lactamase superfamily II)